MLFSLVGSTVKQKIKSKQKNSKSCVFPLTWTQDLSGNYVEGDSFLGVWGAVELPLNRVCTSVINKAGALQLRLHYSDQWSSKGVVWSNENTSGNILYMYNPSTPKFSTEIEENWTL